VPVGILRHCSVSPTKLRPTLLLQPTLPLKIHSTSTLRAVRSAPVNRRKSTGAKAARKMLVKLTPEASTDQSRQSKEYKSLFKKIVLDQANFFVVTLSVLEAKRL
jgi:hypothetical protein